MVFTDEHGAKCNPVYELSTGTRFSLNVHELRLNVDYILAPN